MCQTHAKLIDDNPSIHTVVEIQRWKRQHEDWVFSRIANAENYVRNGVAKFALSDVGPFRARCAVKLGRHNVIYGLNDSGKSTFCEALAAFSGGSNYERFADRFNFCRDGSRSTIVEVGVSRNDSLTTVNLSQQAFQVKGKQKDSSYRIHVEINGNVAAHWPQSLFNVILLDSQLYWRPGGLKDHLAQSLRYLAEQLRISEDVIWDSLREELFLSSALGFRTRRTGPRTIDVLVPDGRDFYLPFDNLSGSEGAFLIMDILLKFLRSSSPSTPWLIMLDTAYFTKFDEEGKQQMVDLLASQDAPEVQTIFCVTYDKDAELLKTSRSDYWIGATSFGKLTIHSFL